MPRIKKSVPIDIPSVPSTPPTPEPQPEPVMKCEMCHRKIIRWRSSKTTTFDWNSRPLHRTCYLKKQMMSSWH